MSGMEREKEPQQEIQRDDGYLAIEHFGSSDQFTYLLDSAAYLKSLMEH